MSDLDMNAIAIEITLISIIEGFALSALAGSAVPGGGKALPLEFVPYAAAGLLFVLIFWSQSVLHAASFIRWPISLAHMLLYFVAAFIQVIAYAHLTEPREWFFWWTVFALVGAVLYLVDLAIIRRERPSFEALEGGGEYMDGVEARHRYEMLVIVTAAILFNGAAYLLFSMDPALVADDCAVFIAGLLQCAAALWTLLDGGQNFSRRCRQIAELYPGDSRTDSL